MVYMSKMQCMRQRFSPQLYINVNGEESKEETKHFFLFINDLQYDQSAHTMQNNIRQHTDLISPVHIR